MLCLRRLRMLKVYFIIDLLFSTAAKIAALEAKLLQMDGGEVSSIATAGGSNTSRKPRQYSTYYSQEHVRRKHGGNIKIQRPQQKFNHRTDAMHHKV